MIRTSSTVSVRETEFGGVAALKLLTFVVVIFLYGCATKVEVWKISRSTQDGNTTLAVTAPADKTDTVVVTSPYDIVSYAIASDGSFIAYIANEYRGYGLFVQELSSGLRVKWITPSDAEGKLEFLPEGKLRYVSTADFVIITLAQVAEKIDDEFGQPQNIVPEPTPVDKN